ncbi:movement protein [Hardenbergia virus A]|uniref:Movement protein n=1 Tax=Hardenbergia virus A TaxID=1003891 RepID=F4ZNH0_9VIRU|nr:movement protein [Hardenbergia virus A]AEB00588.1 movement protein [Hardenbergia virus A]
MQIVNSKSFIDKFDGGQKNVKCIGISDVYSDGGYSKNDKVDSAQTSESSISIRVKGESSRIIQGVPILEPNVLAEERGKKKYSKVNIGAIVISIHKLGYYSKETCKGKCMLVDGRRVGKNGIIHSFGFDISNGPAHFIVAPNAVFDINDEVLDRACQIFFTFENVQYIHGSCPFSIEIGSIYRMSNVFNCHHRLGVPGRKGAIGNTIQEVHGTRILFEDEEDRTISQMEEARISGLISNAGVESNRELHEGRRSFMCPWKKRGPSFYRDYCISSELGSGSKDVCKFRSSTSDIDERRIFENFLDSSAVAPSESSDSQSYIRENGHRRSCCESSVARLDKQSRRVPGRSLWRENEENEKKDTSEELLGVNNEGQFSESRECKHPSEFHGC